MKIDKGNHVNCSEWDEWLEEDDFILPTAVLNAIEEAKLEVGKEWDK